MLWAVLTFAAFVAGLALIVNTLHTLGSPGFLVLGVGLMAPGLFILGTLLLQASFDARQTTETRWDPGNDYYTQRANGTWRGLKK